jgi:hypothetical protein
MGIGPLDYGRVVACCYAIGVFDVGKLGPLNYGGVLACHYEIDVFGVGNHTQDLFYRNLFSSGMDKGLNVLGIWMALEWSDQ